jgi:hypothetical protein
VGDVLPGVAVLTVVLPHRAPLPLREIRAESFPAGVLFGELANAFLFGICRSFGHTSAFLGTVLKINASTLISYIKKIIVL